MGAVVQTIGKELLNRRSAEMSGREANAMNYQQIDECIRRAGVTVGRVALASPEKGSIH